VLQTKFLNEQGVVSVTGLSPLYPISLNHLLTFTYADFFPHQPLTPSCTPTTSKPLLTWLIHTTLPNVDPPQVHFALLDQSTKGHLGLGVIVDLNLVEGQYVALVLRTIPVPLAG